MHVFNSFLMRSADMVLHHFATFGTRLRPTKMPTKMAFSHSKICDLVRGRKVGCNSLNARNAELPRGLPTNCENHALIGCCSEFASLVSIHIRILPLKNNSWSGHVYWAFSRTGLATIAKEHCRRSCREGKGQKRRCCLWSSKRFESKEYLMQLRSFKHGIKSLIFDDPCIFAMIGGRINSLIFPDLRLWNAFVCRTRFGSFQHVATSRSFLPPEKSLR